ncbi:hypothetical protein KQX54_016483 [Cotesia glomerata]|uniref:Uncharacterized protein n=1 Tax=Cotesia glomerata TaxID=32391 RepID=A0AAV7HWD5_COTGL|nr:hypothetical protein KQX54_016483 [Cotesia glomerata]
MNLMADCVGEDTPEDNPLFEAASGRDLPTPLPEPEVTPDGENEDRTLKRHGIRNFARRPTNMLIPSVPPALQHPGQHFSSHTAYSILGTISTSGQKRGTRTWARTFLQLADSALEELFPPSLSLCPWFGGGAR